MDPRPTLRIRQLTWDPSNVEHIARHGVHPQEVAEVCFGAPVVDHSYKGRLRLIGPNRAGRLLAVVLAQQDEGIYYPVTARPASRKERMLYRQVREGTTS